MESCKIEKQALTLHHSGEEFTFINFEIQVILSLTDQVALTTVKIINVFFFFFFILVKTH